MAAATADAPKVRDDQSPYAELSAKKAAAFSEVASALMDEVMPLAKLAEKVSPLTMSVAWANGDIEFGRRKFVVTGNPEADDHESKLIVESDEIQWTGAKTTRHKKYADFLTTESEVPICKMYAKYVMERDHKEKIDFAVRKYIDRAEVVQLLTLQVRLTDKGLAALQAA